MSKKLKWTSEMNQILKMTVKIVVERQEKNDWNQVAKICSRKCGVMLSNKQCRNRQKCLNKCRYSNFACMEFVELRQEDKWYFLRCWCEGKSDKEIIQQLCLQKVSGNSIKKIKKAKKSKLCKDLGVVYKKELSTGQLGEMNEEKCQYRIFGILFQTNELIKHYRSQERPFKLQQLIDCLKDYVETRNKIKLMNKKCSKEAIKTVVSSNEFEDEASRQQEVELKLEQIKEKVHNIMRPMLQIQIQLRDAYRQGVAEKGKRLRKFQARADERLKRLEWILTQEPQKVKRGRIQIKQADLEQEVGDNLPPSDSEFLYMFMSSSGEGENESTWQS